MSDIYSDSAYVQIKSPCEKRFPSPLIQHGYSSPTSITSVLDMTNHHINRPFWRRVFSGISYRGADKQKIQNAEKPSTVSLPI